MFGFFNKAIKLTQQDLIFLERVVKALPSKYNYLSNQIHEDFIIDKTVNKLGNKGTYSLVLNANLEKKYINKKLPIFFILKGIEIWNNKLEAYLQIELHIVQGMIMGFKLDAKHSDLDIENIKANYVCEKHFDNEDVSQLKEILKELSDKEQNQLEIESSFKIEVHEGVFLTIKNTGDGNYLAINLSGEVFELTHDPYKVKYLFGSVSEFLNHENNCLGS